MQNQSVFGAPGLKTAALAFLLLLSTALAAAPPLSPQAEISLLTCSTGPELYKVFGHSAIRVRDPLMGIDRVYNYGTFDFNTENFYLKFARGKLNYWLSVSGFQNFLLEYMYYDQTVYENTFNLAGDEKQKLFDFLENNYLPENRFYLYDFFFDNCATRIRDAVYETFDVKITDSTWYQPVTFREGIENYLYDHPWSHLGIDLGLGAPTDRIMTIDDYMFLPEYLMIGLEGAAISTEDGEKPLLEERIELHAGSSFGSRSDRMNYLLLSLLLIALVFILITYRELMKEIHYFQLDNAAFAFPAVVAIVQALLWFATDHKAAGINPDLLWTGPAFLLLVVRRRRIIARPIFRYLLIASLLSMGFYMALWIFFRINFNLMILPLWMIVAVRIIKLLLFSGQSAVEFEKEQAYSS